MSRYIAEYIRDLVADRANNRCEYCRLAQKNSFFSYHIDHIISLKHGGATSPENLAFSCQICNLNKGSDIATFLEDKAQPTRFYNPRLDNWSEHFEAQETGLPVAKSAIGEGTIKILNLNHFDSIIERCAMIAAGDFPV